MSDPYRKPELPAAEVAQRRLDEKMSEVAERSARERAQKALRMRRLKKALFATTAISALYTALGVALITTVKSALFSGSVLVVGIATPMSLVLALGLKVPPQEGNPVGGMPNGSTGLRGR